MPATAATAATLFLPWSNDYSVHIRNIDSDHKELFDAVNQLHAEIERRSPASEVGFTIGLLARYVHEHFEREERLMAEYDYPQLAEHKMEHWRLKRKVYAIRKIHGDDPKRLDPEKLVDFLRSWLIHHILGSDMKYAAYLHGGAAGKKSADSRQQKKPVTAAKKPAPQPNERVTVEVPAGKARLIRRCAELLLRDGKEAHIIEELTDAIGGMTLEEALSEAAALLR